MLLSSEKLESLCRKVDALAKNHDVTPETRPKILPIPFLEGLLEKIDRDYKTRSKKVENNVHFAIQTRLLSWIEQRDLLAEQQLRAAVADLRHRDLSAAEETIAAQYRDMLLSEKTKLMAQHATKLQEVAAERDDLLRRRAEMLAELEESGQASLSRILREGEDAAAWRQALQEQSEAKQATLSMLEESLRAAHAEVEEKLQAACLEEQKVEETAAAARDQLKIERDAFEQNLTEKEAVFQLYCKDTNAKLNERERQLQEREDAATRAMQQADLAGKTTSEYANKCQTLESTVAELTARCRYLEESNSEAKKWQQAALELFNEDGVHWREHTVHHLEEHNLRLRSAMHELYSICEVVSACCSGTSISGQDCVLTLTSTSKELAAPMLQAVKEGRDEAQRIDSWLKEAAAKTTSLTELAVELQERVAALACWEKEVLLAP